MKMRFFVPETKNETEAQTVWEATKKFAEETLRWEVSERCIFSIAYQHDGKDYYAEVGKPDPRIGELVLVILESDTYLVCTPNRGVLRGMPILVGRNEARKITDFLEYSRGGVSKVVSG